MIYKMLYIYIFLIIWLHYLFKIEKKIQQVQLFNKTINIELSIKVS